MEITRMGRGRFFRYSLLALVGFISLGLSSQIGYAQGKYPSRNIDLIIGFGAGGTADLSGRIFADELSKVLNVMVVPSNKPGATGTLGAVYVLKSKKDGYNLLFNSVSGMVFAPHLLPDIPFDTLRDFVPITLASVSPVFLGVKSDSPIKSLDMLIDYAKKNPGKLTYGTVGPGSDVHLVVEQLQEAAGIKMTQVPFKSGAETITAVLGGHIDVGSLLITTSVPHLKARSLTGIVMSGKKLQAFPEIPTFAEKGFRQHFFTNWTGFFVPVGTPQPIVNTLIEASEKTLKSKSFISRIEELGTQAEFFTPAEFKNLIEEDNKAAAALIEKLGLKEKK